MNKHIPKKSKRLAIRIAEKPGSNGISPVDGDAVIEVKNNDKEITAIVITYQHALV